MGGSTDRALVDVWFSSHADNAQKNETVIGTPTRAGLKSNLREPGSSLRQRWSAMRTARTLPSFDGAVPARSALELAAKAFDGAGFRVWKQRCQTVSLDIPNPYAGGAERLHRLENVRQALAHQLLGFYVGLDWFVVPGDVMLNTFVVVSRLVLKPSSQSLFENVGRAAYARIQEMNAFMGDLPWPLVGTPVLPRVLRDEDIHTASPFKVEASGKVRARSSVRHSDSAKHEPWVAQPEDRFENRYVPCDVRFELTDISLM